MQKACYCTASNKAFRQTRAPGAIRGLLIASLSLTAETFLLRYHLIAMELLLYTSYWCGDCRVAKRFLEQHQIPYKEINIEDTPGAADEVIRNTGKRALPQFVIDGTWVQPYRPGEGFLYEEMSELLGVAKTSN